MSDGLVKILDGNTFVVSDRRGDIEASRTDPTGLFSFDTRFLSQWVLTVDGQRLNPLSVDDLHYFDARFFLVPGTGTVYVDAKLSVIRRRAVGVGFHEQLTIFNHDHEPVDVTVRIEAASDFADLFEVKDALDKKGSYSTRIEDGKLVLSYRRETFVRATEISASPAAALDEAGLTFAVQLEPHGEWTTDIDVSARLLPAGAAERPAQPGAHWQAREHGTQPRALGRRGAPRRVRLGAAPDRLPAFAGRSRRPSLLAADHARQEPAGCRPAVVHDDVRPGQHLHESAGAALHAGARGDDAARAGDVAGHARRRLPRRGPRPDPARDALRGDDGVRGAAALALLRLRRCDRALRRAARRVRAMDRRPRARLRRRVRGPRGAQLDRRVRRPDGQRLRLLPAPQRGDRPGEPVLEGFLGLDLVSRRQAARLPACHVRAAGLRL